MAIRVKSIEFVDENGWKMKVHIEESGKNKTITFPIWNIDGLGWNEWNFIFNVISNVKHYENIHELVLDFEKTFCWHPDNPEDVFNIITIEE